MPDSPYGPQASHRLDGDVPESGAHPPAVSGQIVPAGAHDPAGRSQDPLSPGRAYAPAPGGGYGAPTNIYVVQAPKSVGVAFEIGRASCREREWVSVGAVGVESVTRGQRLK